MEIVIILVLICLKNYIDDQLDSESPIFFFILTFNAYHKTAPQYICNLIIARTYNRAVRSNNSFALVVSMIKLKHYRERSFSYAAPVEWNKLDVEVRLLTNLETFKKNVKTYVFNIAFR